MININNIINTVYELFAYLAETQWRVHSEHRFSCIFEYNRCYLEKNIHSVHNQYDRVQLRFSLVKRKCRESVIPLAPIVHVFTKTGNFRLSYVISLLRLIFNEEKPVLHPSVRWGAFLTSPREKMGM